MEHHHSIHDGAGMIIKISDWLTSISMGKYIQLFEDNDISSDLLFDLTQEDLKDIGISSVGDRMRILLALKKLSALQSMNSMMRPSSVGGPSNSSTVTPSGSGEKAQLYRSTSSTNSVQLQQQQQQQRFGGNSSLLQTANHRPSPADDQRQISQPQQQGRSAFVPPPSLMISTSPATLQPALPKSSFIPGAFNSGISGATAPLSQRNATEVRGLARLNPANVNNSGNTPPLPLPPPPPPQQPTIKSSQSNHAIMVNSADLGSDSKSFDIPSELPSYSQQLRSADSLLNSASTTPMTARSGGVGAKKEPQKMIRIFFEDTGDSKVLNITNCHDIRQFHTEVYRKFKSNLPASQQQRKQISDNPHERPWYFSLTDPGNHEGTKLPIMNDMQLQQFIETMESTVDTERPLPNLYLIPVDKGGDSSLPELTSGDGDGDGDGNDDREDRSAFSKNKLGGSGGKLNGGSGHSLSKLEKIFGERLPTNGGSLSNSSSPLGSSSSLRQVKTSPTKSGATANSASAINAASSSSAAAAAAASNTGTKWSPQNMLMKWFGSRPSTEQITNNLDKFFPRANQVGVLSNNVTPPRAVIADLSLQRGRNQSLDRVGGLNNSQHPHIIQPSSASNSAVLWGSESDELNKGFRREISGSSLADAENPFNQSSNSIKATLTRQGQVSGRSPSPLSSAHQQQPQQPPISQQSSLPESSSKPPDSISSLAHRKFKWIRGSLIGTGSFGNVYLGWNTSNDQLMAVKQVALPKEMSASGGGSSDDQLAPVSSPYQLKMRQRRQLMIEALQREINLLKEIDHPNIVRYFGSENTEDALNIFLEYIPGGSLASIVAHDGAIDEPQARNFTRQIVDGLKYLHDRNIIHRDIKGGNILVNKGIAKIGDFGISKKIVPPNEDARGSVISIYRGADAAQQRTSNLQGSVYWMAPEVVKHYHYTKKSDIWGLGCVIIEMISGKHPWPEYSQMQALFKIGSYETPPFPENISGEAKDILDKTLALNYKERPNAATLQQHPFLVKDNFE